ncbi:PaaX family transcriptional regulator C-terminal domain-containing protein [Actinomadura sp. 3N508]|uniref:PaaX family transcriptional regulator n=1 Tax=Actinomadura sp. 3N508 TaxID=3375153 RepID=UPI0037B21CD6
MQESESDRIDGTWTGATPSMATTPRSGAAADSGAGRPKMLIMDVCGAYMRPLGGWFAIAKIVQLMNELGVDEAATRSALLRMRRKGLLEPENRPGARGLRLTDQALTALEDTDRRIFGPRPPAYLGDGWILLSFSVPEDQRAKRHVLRSQLSWLGFGNLGNGLWMAPRRMRDALKKTVEQLGFQQYVLMFEAQYTGFTELSALVGEAWDLAELATLYTEFVDWCAPIAERWQDVRSPAGPQAFIDYTLALYHWRKFPYLDPGLPKDLLPDDWAGHRAAELFFDLRNRLEAGAIDHVRKVCAF